MIKSLLIAAALTLQNFFTKTLPWQEPVLKEQLEPKPYEDPYELVMADYLAPECDVPDERKQYAEWVMMGATEECTDPEARAEYMRLWFHKAHHAVRHVKQPHRPMHKRAGWGADAHKELDNRNDEGLK